MKVTDPSGIGPPDVTVAFRSTRTGVTAMESVEERVVPVDRGKMLKLAPVLVMV